MFMNLWYVAAFSDDVKRTPTKVRMLTRDFVLFRDHHGKAVCLSNVCPHRGASLAQGKCLEDGTLQCPQHGWRFGDDGRCRVIPSGGEILPGARVDSYPTQEAHGLVWTFLGDDLASAPPIPAMPECDLPGWRTQRHGEIWNCNYHWAKFSNIDLVHVPFVHGQNFTGSTLTPKEHFSRPDDYSIASRIVTPFTMPGRNWQGLREEGKEVESTLTFMVSGFTLKGHLEIGGKGSGVFTTFYEMSTPITAETTYMRYFFVRNFMPEPTYDEDYLKRNLKNVTEDRLIAETQLPKRGPMPPSSRDLIIDPEDTMLMGYWQILERLRKRGGQIDVNALEKTDHGHRYTTIPSPARKADSRQWVHDSAPTMA
jgi:phenylpropionate dioxygenase-like ring-hydroxylating dioxygenase large terminal subunit